MTAPDSTPTSSPQEPLAADVRRLVQRESSDRVIALMAPLLVAALLAMSVAFWLLPTGRTSAWVMLGAAFVVAFAGVLNWAGRHQAAAIILACAAILVPLAEPISTGDLSTNAYFVGITCVFTLLIVERRYRWWVIASSGSSLLAMILLTDPQSTIEVTRHGMLVSGTALLVLSLTAAYFLLRTFSRMAEQAAAARLVATRRDAEISAGNDQLTDAITARSHELAAAIEARKALALRLQESVVRDPLTGLFNRRYLDESLGRVLTAPAAVAILDVDSFKLINDRLSYAVGDRVLQRIASILAEAVRDSDLLARYGGEEFALLMPGTTADEAPAVVNRLRTHVADHDWTSVHPKLTVTMSAGVCVHARASFASMPTSDLVNARLSMLERADQALRTAKAQGRDRTIVVRC